MSFPSSPWSSGATSPTYDASTRYSRGLNQRALGSNMNYPSFQGLPSSRNGHARARSTVTVSRPPWFAESRNASPPLGPGAVLQPQMPASTLRIGQTYCVDRGNGEYTMLIPADMLPPLNEVPARQTQPHGMVILPSFGQQASARPFTLKVSDITSKHDFFFGTLANRFYIERESGGPVFSSKCQSRRVLI